MPTAGDVVVFDFPGALGFKRRPAVIISSDIYHRGRPDVILGVITSNISAANAPTDYLLQDWAMAGLRKPSAFRVYLVTTLPSSTHRIGGLSQRDWDAVHERVRLAID